MIIQSAAQTADVRTVLSYAVIIPKADNAVTIIIVGEIIGEASLCSAALRKRMAPIPNEVGKHNAHFVRCCGPALGVYT